MKKEVKIVKNNKKNYDIQKILNIRTITRTCIYTCLVLLIIMIYFSGLKSVALKSPDNWVVHDMAEPVLRVHILAHNNSPEEQNLKNRVRDDFLALTSHYSDESSWQELIETIEQERHLLEVALNKKIIKYGTANNREAEVKLQKEFFPLRHYGEKIYPPGEYMALIVTIGEGKGENWWCLLYPALCFPLAQVNEKASTEEGMVKENNNDVVEAMATFKLSNKNKTEVDSEKEEKTEGRWKFKIWEWIKSTFEKK